MRRLLYLALLMLFAGCGSGSPLEAGAPPSSAEPLLSRAGELRTLSLAPGWNSVAFPWTRLSQLEATGVAGMAWYDGRVYQTRELSLSTVGSEGGTTRGFWIYSPGGGQVSFQDGGQPAPTSLSVRAAWNLVAFPGVGELAASQLQTSSDLLLYELSSSGAATPVDLRSGRILSGRAYWLYAAQAGTISWSGPTASPTPSPAATAANLYVAICTHNEDTARDPDYASDRTAYRDSRAGVLQFASLLKSRNLVWNWQSDWNFLNAVIRYDITERDPEFLSQTNGQNLVYYLKNSCGVEIDPHSHEGNGYNYADVAYLISQTGVEPSGVVGGHIWDPAQPTYTNWPKFLAGLTGSKYPSYTWKPSLLMGAGSPNHTNDPIATGLWKPLSPLEFFTHSDAQTLAAWGTGYKSEGPEGMVAQVKTLDPSSMWTGAYIFDQNTLSSPQTLAQVESLAALRDSGQLQIVQLEKGLEVWRDAYAGKGSVYRIR